MTCLSSGIKSRCSFIYLIPSGQGHDESTAYPGHSGSEARIHSEWGCELITFTLIHTYCHVYGRKPKNLEETKAELRLKPETWRCC